jgi:hypothetical protein
VSLLLVHADYEEQLMQHTLHALTGRVIEAARRSFDAFLPSSALSGLGRNSELAAQHPAFADPAEWFTRRAV